MREAGIEAAELVRASPDSAIFGDTEAVFRVAGLLLRFVRDRGQEFMDLAANAAPERFHQFDDVEIAMGWKTIDQVLAKREPENLSQVLARVSRHLKELDEAFSPERERFTRVRIERVAHESKRIQDAKRSASFEKMAINDTRSIDDLLSARIAWIKEVGLPRWRATYRGEKCELTMNNFPEEALFTLKWRGESIDFDDSPSTWSIPRN